MSDITVNINDYVDVELTDKGLEILEKFHTDLGVSFVPGQFQLWELMMIFGPHIYLGADNLFKDNEIGFYQ